MSDEEDSICNMFTETESNSFTIKNIYGFDKEIGISYYCNNLNEDCIIYIVSNMIIIYNLTTSSYQYYSGHEEKIQLCKIDHNEKIMITSDKESIFIWDIKCHENSELTLLRKLHEPFGEETVDISTAGLSSCGKYLIVVSKIICENVDEILENDKENIKKIKDVKKCFLQYWEWSYGHEECNDSIVLPHKYGPIKTITFSTNKNEEHFFAMTFKNIVLFGTIEENGKIKIHIPFNSHSRICNELNRTCYLEKSYVTVSVSSRGRLIIWLDLQHHNSNNKNYFRMLQLRNCSINDVKNFDNYIVIADEFGEVRFYNYDYLLMYVYNNDNFKSINILSICPVSEKRTRDSSPIEYDNNDKYSKKVYATDFTKEQNLFLVREIFIVTETGSIQFCDMSKDICKSILQTNTDIRIASDVFRTKLITVSCMANGFVNVFNYKTNILIGGNCLNQYYKTKMKPLITACKISPDELYIFVGMQNSDLWILDTVTAKPINSRPLHAACKQIDKIVFHPTDYLICAISTCDYTLLLLQYTENKWQIVCKYRYHCKPILNIMFLQLNNINYVITIGEDRMYIKYEININHNPLVPILDVRLDQIPKISCAELFDSTVLAVDTSRHGKVILTANDAFKFVFYDAWTAKMLFTFLGPIFESPIRNILYLPSTQDNPDSFLIISTNKTLGAALLPLDGNPYRYSGFKAQVDKIIDVHLTCNDSIVLHGDKCTGSYWWSLNKNYIKEKFLSNGDGLEPFCRLLPGGKSGWFFKEVQEYFFYFQLIIKKNNIKHQLTDFMYISEIPDFMRAIGYFPSEYEILNFLSEIEDTNRIVENAALDEKKISFTELIKLYINHKPVFGYTLDDIFNSIRYIKMTKDNYISEKNEKIKLTMDEILSILTENYEKITKLQAMKYLKELLKPNKNSNSYVELTPEEIEKEFNQLPNDFTIFEFCNYLLGLDLLPSPKDDNLSKEEGSKENKYLLPRRVPNLLQNDINIKNYFES